MTTSNSMSRRSALKAIFVGAAGLALGGCASKTPTPPWETAPWPEELPRPSQRKNKTCKNCLVAWWATDENGKNGRNTKYEYDAIVGHLCCCNYWLCGV